MGITGAEAREQIVEDLGNAIDRIAFASGRLGEAYELLAVDSADRMEEKLFRPVQKAFGRAKRTYNRFAGAHGVPTRAFEAPDEGRRAEGAKGFIEQAVLAAAEADIQLSDLQDSMMPIEFGDPELRSGLADTRDLLAQLPVNSREFLRSLGR